MSLPIAPAALVSCGFLALTMRMPSPVQEFFKRFLQRVYDKIGDDAAEWIAKFFGTLFLLSSGMQWDTLGCDYLREDVRRGRRSTSDGGPRSLFTAVRLIMDLHADQRNPPRWSYSVTREKRPVFAAIGQKSLVADD
jgi:hypothetical protein